MAKRTDLSRVLEIVKDVLASDKRARVNDFWGLTRGWKHKDVKGIEVNDYPNGDVLVYIKAWALNDAPKPESFRRVRAKLQSEGQYLPKDAVTEKREKLAEEYRRELGAGWPG